MRNKLFILLIAFLSGCKWWPTFAEREQQEGEYAPVTWGKYEIQNIINEVGLATSWTLTESLSGCGLGNNDFIKYAMSRVDRRRNFQFIAFNDILELYI